MEEFNYPYFSVKLEAHGVNEAFNYYFKYFSGLSKEDVLTGGLEVVRKLEEQYNVVDSGTRRGFVSERIVHSAVENLCIMVDADRKTKGFSLLKSANEVL